MGNTKETMSFIKWIDVLGAVQLLLEENAQPVSYTQMDSLTCGIYPLIPLSDTGFPSHTSADSNFLLQMLPITSMFPSSTHKEVRCGHFRAIWAAKGARPGLACGSAQPRGHFLWTGLCPTSNASQRAVSWAKGTRHCRALFSSLHFLGAPAVPSTDRNRQ